MCPQLQNMSCFKSIRRYWVRNVTKFSERKIQYSITYQTITQPNSIVGNIYAVCGGKTHF